ncbi:DUF2291 family protein [Pseudomonas kulmbachensis]|uniref:DUF2291 family protein n=1 Tax=Pseudomonas kulmbachensis TaxID=3043408 RepID=UPI002AB059C5|nr:DUF2291 family protein [Pseudomonas sp. FLM 004-28]
MSLVSSGKSQPLSSRGQPALFLTGGICAVLLGLSALNGPLISIRKLDPVTGKVALNNARAANAEGQNQTFALSSFDANQFVTQQWVGDVETVVAERTVDLTQLLTAINQNPAQAALDYSVPHDGQAKNFIVSARAKVSEVNVKSPMGLLELELPAGSVPASVKIQLLAGPLVISTTLRDVATNMSLNNFTNQTQYADVAAALNRKALAQAYAAAPVAELKGKTIEFTGVFNLQSPATIRILPISLTVEE